MKKLKLTLILITLLQITQLYAKEKREITLYGKIDPRLNAYALSVYRSFSPNEVEMTEENKECFKNDWNTATKKATLGYELADIIPDNDGNYKTIIPIDYTGDNPCGYEYSSTKIRIKRDKEKEKEDNPDIIILGNKRLSDYIETDKKYLQISSGSKIECHTKHYKGISPVTKKYRESTRLICEPKVANEINGVDEIKNVSLNLDIIIKRNSLLFDDTDPTFKRGFPKDEKFREYKEAPTFFEKIKNFFK